MKIGWGMGCYTPDAGIIIAGMAPFRATDTIHDDVYATAMVLQSGDSRVIWVSCDMCHPTGHLMKDAVEALSSEIPDFREEEFILNTTHATACFYLTDQEFLMSGFRMPLDKVEPIDTTRARVCRAIVKAVKTALSSMEECSASVSSADILTGYCRRVVYADGSAEMYGDVHRDDFMRMEYPDGGASQFIYFRRCSDNKLTGVFANIPCPAQADENSEYVTADYWGVVRGRLRDAYGPDIFVLGTCRAAGELSPHRMLITPDKDRSLEWGRAVAERLGNLISDSIICSEKDKKMAIPSDADVSMMNEWVKFPIRQTDENQYAEAMEYFADKNNFDENGVEKDWEKMANYSHIRFLWEKKPEPYGARISAVKIGDVVLYTAPFELFTEYAARVMVRFRDLDLFDVQLAQDCLGYLPPKEAIARGGYSAMISDNVTDDVGGDLYVEEMTKLIRKLAGGAQP